MKVLITQLCPTVIPRTVSSVHGISQAAILEWVAIYFSKGSSWPRNPTQVSCIVGIFITVWTTRDRKSAMKIKISQI